MKPSEIFWMCLILLLGFVFIPYVMLIFFLVIYWYIFPLSLYLDVYDNFTYWTSSAAPFLDKYKEISKWIKYTNPTLFLIYCICKFNQYLNDKFK